jgi:hypothetical protein
MKALDTAAVIPDAVSCIVSWHTVTDASFLYDTAAMLGDTIKETACADVVNNTSVAIM